MRYRISFKANKPFTLIWNYQYFFNICITRFFKHLYFKKLISGEFDKSIKTISSSKLFCYSKLMINNNQELITGQSGIENVKKCYFVFSTPFDLIDSKMIDEHFKNQHLLLLLENTTIELQIEKIEILKETFCGEYFTCVSPIAVNEKNRLVSKNCITYNPNKTNKLFSTLLKQDLMNKYKALTGKDYPNDFDFEFYFDKEYIEKRKNNISKLITFETRKIKAYEAPFTIKAPPDLIEIAYKCGLGNNNDIGFGCIESVKNKLKA